MSRLLIPLNDTIVVCLPGGDTRPQPKFVTQLSCKTERQEDIDTITTYYMVRHELSELILRTVMAHLKKPLPSALTFEGDTYQLHARHSPWTFGKKIDFMWGDEALRPCEDKWTFLFTVRSQPSTS